MQAYKLWWDEKGDSCENKVELEHSTYTICSSL